MAKFIFGMTLCKDLGMNPLSKIFIFFQRPFLQTLRFRSFSSAFHRSRFGLFVSGLQSAADTFWNGLLRSLRIAPFYAVCRSVSERRYVPLVPNVFQTIGIMPLFFRYSHAAASVSTPSSLWSFTIFMYLCLSVM